MVGAFKTKIRVPKCNVYIDAYDFYLTKQRKQTDKFIMNMVSWMIKTYSKSETK